jgi:hypothetical protein
MAFILFFCFSKGQNFPQNRETFSVIFCKVNFAPPQNYHYMFQNAPCENLFNPITTERYYYGAETFEQL